MPPVFMKENKKMLAKTCLLKTDVGMLWEAKIVREGSDFFLCEGDWPQFVVYHKLELGVILLFFLIDKSMFVLPYSQKCCRNLRDRQLLEELSSSSGEEEEEDIGASRKLKKSKTGPIELTDSEEESVDPSSGTKDEGNSGFIKKGGKSDAEAENMLGVKKKTPGLKEQRRHAKDPEKTKSVVRDLLVDQGKRRRLGCRSAKDPDKPKRPESAFFVLLEEFRKQFVKENPNIKFVVSALGKASGDKWKQLSNADKAPYIAEAEKRKAKYQKNMSAYKKPVAAESAEEEESYKSEPEADEEEESEERKEDIDLFWE